MSSLKTVFFILLFLALPSFAFGSETQLIEQFSKSYFNQGSQPDYFPGWCPNNIFKLSSRLDLAQIDLEQAEVWYIYRHDIHNKLDFIYPMESRSWAGDGWMFHVILVMGGAVLDMDYMQQPTIEPLKEYFQKMFPEIDGKNLDLLVKVLPAEEFLKDYIPQYSYRPRWILGADTDTQYPPQTLESKLR